MHALGRSAPIGCVRVAKYEQVFLGWSASGDVPSLPCKLQVIRSRSASQYQSIEPVMVFEFEKHQQTETIAIEPQKSMKVIAGSRNSKRGYLRPHSNHQQECGLNLAVCRREQCPAECSLGVRVACPEIYSVRL